MSETLAARRSSWLLLFAGAPLAVFLGIWLAANPLAGLLAGITLLFLIGITFTNHFNRVIFTLFYAELILGGRGRAIELWKVIPIRLAIGVLLILAFLLALLGDGRGSNFSLRKCRSGLVAALLGTGTFLFFGLLIGRFNGNPIDFIVGDARGFLFLTAAIPLFFFATRKTPDIKFAMACLLSIVGVFAAAKSFGYALILAHIMSVQQLSTMVEAYIPQEIGAGTHSSLITVSRLYMSGDVWIMFALILCVSLALAPQSRRTKAMLYGAMGFMFFGLVSSQSRGLWLATLLGFAAVLWLSNVSNKLKVAVILPFMFLALLALSPTLADSVQETVKMSFDFKESSNSGRLDQFRPLMDTAEKHIFLGNGYGSTAPGYAKAGETPWEYELQPVALLMKMGILGCGVWLVFLFWLIRELRGLFRRAKDPYHHAVARGLLGGLLGMLFVSGTNPTFANSVGMGCLVFTVIVADMVRVHLQAKPRPEGASSGADGHVDACRLPSPVCRQKGIVGVNSRLTAFRSLKRQT